MALMLSLFARLIALYCSKSFLSPPKATDKQNIFNENNTFVIPAALLVNKNAGNRS